MNTLTTDDIRDNIDLLFANYGKESFLVKNNKGESFLIMPFSKDEKEEVLLKVYQAFKELDDTFQEADSEKDLTPTQFFEKWNGLLNDVDLSGNWRDDYTNHLIKKHL